MLPMPLRPQRVGILCLTGGGSRVNDFSPGVSDTPILDGQHEPKEESDAMRAMDIKMTQMGGFCWVEEMPSRDLQTNMLDQVIVRSVMGSKG